MGQTSFEDMPSFIISQADESDSDSNEEEESDSDRTVYTKILALYSRAKLNPLLARNYATIVKRELEVPTFCDIYIDLPYHVKLKPLNIHKYHNCDKLMIQVEERFEHSIEHEINGNQVRIFSTVDSVENNRSVCLTDVFCNIKAPIKANLYVNSEKDILVGYFNGDKLHLKSESNIFVDKFQGNSVKLTTNKGNLHFKDFVQASTVIAEILEDGSINSGRIQSLNLKLKTKKGNISVESAYSNESLFEVVSGNLDLHNIHKSCKILLKEGNINLTGFDGNLTTILENGSADIQLSRISNNSEINILNGSLNLKIADACQDYTQFEVQSKHCDIAENVKSTISRNKELVILTPDINKDNTVFIKCLNGTVNIESASWHDMIKLKLKK